MMSVPTEPLKSEPARQMDPPLTGATKMQGEESQHVGPAWHYTGGVPYRGIPEGLKLPNTKVIDPVSPEPAEGALPRRMRPVLHSGFVNNSQMGEGTEAVVRNYLETRGWEQFNGIVKAPDGTRYFKFTTSDTKHLAIQVVESKWLQGLNEDRFSHALGSLTAMERALNPQGNLEINKFVFSDFPTQDYFFSTKPGTQSTLANVCIKDFISGKAWDDIGRMFLERTLASHGKLVPGEHLLRQVFERQNLSGVEMSDFLDVRKNLLERARGGDQEVAHAFFEETKARLDLIQQIHQKLSKSQGDIANRMFGRERLALANSDVCGSQSVDRASRSILFDHGVRLSQ